MCHRLMALRSLTPRRSQIDIIQAVGRAIRLSPEKQKGTIIIPVFIEDNDDPELAIKESNFKPVWDVLNALKAHDEVLSDQLNQIRIQLGKIPKSSVASNSLTKIFFDSPRTVDKSFASKLRTYLVENTTESWMFWYGLLLEYEEENGHCRVPTTHKTTDGYKLGAWVNNQRSIKDTLSPERQEQLESLNGWVWDILEFQWEEGFNHIKVYANTHGHCRVPGNYKSTDGFKLGSWVNYQRSIKDALSLDRRERLEALNGWVWDILEFQWEEGFKYLRAYSDEHGHSEVPDTYKTINGYRLGEWVGKQRTKRNTMSPERQERLEALNGWVWDKREYEWGKGFKYLMAYTDAHGHCRVPQRHKTTDGFRLGSWVVTKRHRKDTLSPERQEQLESLNGWVWNPFATQWEEGFKYLRAYSDEHGHCRVPTIHKTTDGYKLGAWVDRQRQNKDTLSSEHKKQLESLNGWVWNPFATQWEEGFKYLRAYSDEHGHCRVLATHKTKDGYALGRWVTTQRRNKDTMSPERRERLGSLPGWVWSARK